MIVAAVKAATVLAPPSEPSASTARREGEKQSVTPVSLVESGEVSRNDALANIEVNSSLTTSSPATEKGSGVGSSTVAEMHDIVRATCKIKIDLADLCVTSEERHAHFKRQCGGAEKCLACNAQKVLRSSRREAARVANASIRMRSLMDGALVDRYQYQHGRAPKGAEWKEAVDFAPIAIQLVAGNLSPAESSALAVKCLRYPADGGRPLFYAYPILMKIAPDLSAGIVSMVDKSVSDKWQADRWNALISLEKSPPHYRYTNPIPLRKGDVSITVSADSRYLLCFSLRSSAARKADELVPKEGHRREFKLPLIARDEYMREVLTLVTSDNARLGALQITEDAKRPGRWYVRIAYRRAVAKRTGGRAAAINKGMACFLAGITETGSQWLYDGDDIEAYLKQIQARRQKHQRQVKASSRIGHGRGRTLRPIAHLAGAAERWRETRCQTIARRFVNWLVTEQVTRLYIDDFTGIRQTPPEELLGGEWIWKRIQEWPYYQLQMRISACCEEAGIETIVRNPSGISSECSFCGSRAVTIIQRRLRCTECKRVRHLDISAAAINLQHGERERFNPQLDNEAESSVKGKGKKSKKGGARKPPAKPKKSLGKKDTGGEA